RVATAPPLISTLSLHAALPISGCNFRRQRAIALVRQVRTNLRKRGGKIRSAGARRSQHLVRREASRSDHASPNDMPTVILRPLRDRKSTRLNSSHLGISYAVFC